MDLDPLDFAETTLAGSQRSTLSPHDSQISIGSQQIGGLIIPGGSTSSMIGGPVGGFQGFGSARGDSVARTRMDAGKLLDLDDLGITIMPDGSMHMSDVPVRRPAGSTGVGDRTSTGRGSSHVQSAHEQEQADKHIVSSHANELTRLPR